MKIRTITCSSAENYGARLQAAALAEWLCGEGYDAQVIDYRPWYMRFYPRKPLRRMGLRELVHELYLWNYNTRRKIRHEHFEDFSSRYGRRTTEIYKGVKALQTTPPEADVLIAGSDQIWNTTMRNGSDPAFFLDFGDRNCRRISYAASFGTATVAEDMTGQLRERLAAFNRISVRERSGADIIVRLGLSRPFIAVDPVFLPEKSYWEEMATDVHIDGSYILVYDFMQSSVVKNVTQRLATITGSKIVAVGARPIRYADHNCLTASPEEFLGLVRGARYVVSNSFHGSAFAMVFNRDFLVVEREDGLNERMLHLLNRYGLDSRLVDAATPDNTIAAAVDYNLLQPMLDRDIEESKNFLRKALTE